MDKGIKLSGVPSGNTQFEKDVIKTLATINNNLALLVDILSSQKKQ